MIDAIALKIKLGDYKLHKKLKEEYYECLKTIKKDYEFTDYEDVKMFAVLVYKNVICDSIITTTITKRNYKEKL